ncbi:hypothetical protein C4F50_07635 [Flavobacterium sp. KB82]|uniref:Uncharacterized protein n=1 Tax=Flavobacterium hungaricum TaxID=2082725 RepID=A0ABR9TJH9_9FLAO|nr:hypothetical protein [Flavobacterium hungaricum]
METLLCQKVCKITTNILIYKTNRNDYQPIVQEQEVFGFFKTFSPAFALIFSVSLKKQDRKG